jgi:hypothetical protein
VPTHSSNKPNANDQRRRPINQNGHDQLGEAAGGARFCSGALRGERLTSPKQGGQRRRRDASHFRHSAMQSVFHMRRCHVTSCDEQAAKDTQVDPGWFASRVLKIKPRFKNIALKYCSRQGTRWTGRHSSLRRSYSFHIHVARPSLQSTWR